MTLKPGELLAAVRQDVRQARATIRARRSHLDETVAVAEAAMERARAEADATSGPETEEALEAWRVLAGDAAPGTASKAWEDWPAELEQSDGEPSLYRIGSMPGGIPALVPLLDAGHLRILGGDLATADAVVDALLVRIVATTRAGSVRISL